MAKLRLSIILPVFNEEKRILNGLKSIQRFFEKEPYSYEVLIVNNGSEDKTQEMALNFIKKKKNWFFTSIPYPAKGEAVKMGFLQAKGEYVLFTDIDLPIGLTQLKNFWRALDQGNDIVIASKFLSGSYSTTSNSLSRRTASRVFNLLTRKLLGLTFTDTQCGFKIFKRKRVLPIINGIKTKGLCFDVEILLKAKARKLKIKELPVQWSNPKSFNIKLSKTSIFMFFDLLKIWVQQKNF